MSDVDPITAEEAEVARCLEDYRAQRATGAHPDPAGYRESLGPAFEDFLDVLAAETFLDEALTVPREFQLPRPFGQYRLERELGRGSSGVVYEAVEAHSETPVALKVMRAAFDTDVNARERFLREAQACKQVTHPCIVEIISAGEIEGRPYYAMTLIRGSSLAALTRRGEAPDPIPLCSGLAGVASALALMHAHGIVHRDIKPSNIMVQADGHMVLADFGLARVELASTLTRTGSSLGTPLYMSPEQMMSRREEIDGRSDIYGLGATLYEALAGKPPFCAEEYRTLVPKILAERPLPPSSIAPGVPRDCSLVALKCLEKHPNDRYQTAKELADDLTAFVDGRPVRGRPVSGLGRSVRKARQHPLLVSVAVAAVILGTLLLTVFQPPPTPALLDIRLVRPTHAMIAVDGKALTVNGTATALAGLADYELEPGKHTIRCEAPGYFAFEDTFVARSGETRTYNISMDMTPALLQEISRKLRESAERAGTPDDD